MINKIQLDTIYWQLLELRGLADTKKLPSIDDSMDILAKELGYSTYTNEYFKGSFKGRNNV